MSYKNNHGPQPNGPATVVVCHGSGCELARWVPGYLPATLDVARRESRLDHLCYVLMGLRIRAAFRDGRELDLPRG